MTTLFQAPTPPHIKHLPFQLNESITHGNIQLDMVAKGSILYEQYVMYSHFVMEKEQVWGYSYTLYYHESTDE